MASNFLKEQRGAVSSFWDREVSTRLSDSYHWLENQAAGYWGLIEKSGWKPREKTMTAANREELLSPAATPGTPEHGAARRALLIGGGLGVLSLIDYARWLTYYAECGTSQGFSV